MGLESFFGMATTMNYGYSRSSNNFSHEAQSRRWRGCANEDNTRNKHAIHKSAEKVDNPSTEKITTEIVDDIPEDISLSIGDDW